VHVSAVQVDGDTKNTAKIYIYIPMYSANSTKQGARHFESGQIFHLFEIILEVTQSCGSLALF
jgi:hypothetical protein